MLGIWILKHRSCWKGDWIAFRILQDQQIPGRMFGNPDRGNALRSMHSHLALSIQDLLALKQRAMKVNVNKSFFYSVLQKASVIWAGCRHNKKATTGTCIWFV